MCTDLLEIFFYEKISRGFNTLLSTAASSCVILTFELWSECG